VEKIGIVGTGISSMAAGYFLRKDYDITFFEKEMHSGGHTNTVMVDEDGEMIPIDSAFMVFNRVTYPNLTRLFEELDVEIMNTTMSFSVADTTSGLEYCGTGINGLFAQRRNIFRPAHYKMIMDINRFNKESPEVLDSPKYRDYSLAEYVIEKGYGQNMIDRYLIPMSSAVWSTPPKLMMEFPAITLVQFFKNHGFLGMKTQHQWETVVGGSQKYKEKILKHFQGKVRLNAAVKKVTRKEKKVTIEDFKGRKYTFDKVILGSHADETLKMLSDASTKERDLLLKFPYHSNVATLHTDESVMPKCKRSWSSWNYRIKRDQEGNVNTSTIYYMNSLQKVSQKKDYFVSINEMGEIDRSKVIWEKTYTHPLFGVGSQEAQKDLRRLNKNGPLYFCGAYFKYGFHEDGFVSGMDVARCILGRDPWS